MHGSGLLCVRGELWVPGIMTTCRAAAVWVMLAGVAAGDVRSKLLITAGMSDPRFRSRQGCQIQGSDHGRQQIECPPDDLSGPSSHSSTFKRSPAWLVSMLDAPAPSA